MTSLQTKSQKNSPTNKRLRGFTVVASLISLGIYAGCNYKTGNDNSGSGGAPAVAAGAVPTYAVLSSTILQPKCFSCHDGNTAGAHDIRSFAAFSVELPDVRSRIHDSSPQNHMPRGGNELTTSELATLDAWINAGGPQNGVAAASKIF